MSVAIVLPEASDAQSLLCPLLCQILRILCCSSRCCSVYVLMQADVTAALGTIQIMVGLVNIGLGPGRTSTRPGDLTSVGAAYWLGAVYTLVGIMSVFAGGRPSHCLVGFGVFVNVVGCIFAIAGIVLYAIDLGDTSVVWMCAWNQLNADHFGDNCRSVAFFVQSLLTGMDITLIVLAVLQLCVCISVAVLGVKSLANGKKEEDGRGVDMYQPVLKEVFMTFPGA
ncbi:putative membrane-spanning 4-domains subfamily A member 3-like [Scophthalmus maximus]|uniref:Putative membrane-spanning 4-domains subfamily A member 3-like n=1 Tax=Scophthalmus maximus TaxID=52904 RepID=A0A2U9AWU0_SCOMX|nr:putative membrane-spanning 4-domains subfamily A member 3-like [Scophthalmus maximus]